MILYFVFKLQSINLPNSLGKLYATFTELLGYKSDNDEWKVMAMSAYDTDCKDEVKKKMTKEQIKQALTGNSRMGRQSRH